MLLFSLSLWTWYLLHFCHACLNRLLSELAVAQCSSFVKHLEWITAMCFVAMLECSSLFLMHLDGLMLLIADRCHICFACHLQTVHPILVNFISISNEINSSFQWHSWFSKLSPGSTFPFQNMHITSRISCHVCIMLLEHCMWLIVFLFASCSCLDRARRRVRERGARWVCLRGSRQLWKLCRQDDHTLKITSIFAC